MTLFQAIITAVVGAFAEIFPVGPGAHFTLLEYFFGWNSGHPSLQGAIELGLFLALLFSLRHDFLAQVSSLLQVVVYRKAPRAMDERMPLFVLIAAVFPVAAFLLLHGGAIPGLDLSPINPAERPYVFAAVFGLCGIPMAFFDGYMRKNKSIYDWNFVDATLVGIGSALVAIPEIGRTTGAFTVSPLRNYSREGAGKFILYVATPVLGLKAWYYLKGAGSAYALGEFPKLYFWATLVVSFAAGLFAITSFLSSLARVSLTRWAIYRLLIAGAVLAVHFMRAKEAVVP
jgi:undecaprenyl-diphosphatase